MMRAYSTASQLGHPTCVLMFIAALILIFHNCNVSIYYHLLCFYRQMGLNGKRVNL